MFSVCVLLYGDYPELALRCLRSLVRDRLGPPVQDLRIGLNAVSPLTLTIAETVARGCGVPAYLYSEASGKNVYKYPLMRRMIYDQERPVGAGLVWFDDDSYFGDWKSPWEDLVPLVHQYHLVGKLYFPNDKSELTPFQLAAIKHQKWYKGQLMGNRPRFITGGWWACLMEHLARWDYPFPELIHNGGDVLLGALAWQQGYKLGAPTGPVHVNADERGRDSRAERRGEVTRRPWEDGLPAYYDHQHFQLVVRELGT